MQLLYLKILDDKRGNHLAFVKKDINFFGEIYIEWDEIKKQLKISNNNQYYNSLYGKKIRVTSIVGANGVGKSTLLRFIQYLIARINEYEKINDYEFNTWDWVAVGYDKTLFRFTPNIVSGDDSEFYERRNILKDELEFDLLKGMIEATKKSSSIFYSSHLELIEPRLDEPDYVDVSSDFLIYKDSHNKEEDQDISKIINFRRNEVKRQISFVQYVESQKKSNVSFYENFVKDSISIEFHQFLKKFDSDPRYIDFNDIKIYKKLDKAFLSLNSSLIYSITRKKRGKDAELQLAELWFYKRLFEIFFDNVEYRPDPKEYDNGEYRFKIQSKPEDFYNNESAIENFKNFFNNQLLINKKKHNEFLVHVSEFIKLIEGHFIYANNEKSFYCNFDTAKKILKIEKSILKLLPFPNTLPIINFDWDDMSTGERAYLNLFSRLNEGYQILKNHKNIKKSELIYLLIDEPSTGFHPQWEKEYLNVLIEFLNDRINENIHLIIATHSPYLITDIQIEDVVQLHSSEKQINIIDNTFGANIHDLLADSFYLQNGYMGDFARLKIEKIANLINKEKLSEDEIEEIKSIIKIIGEPILKERLEFLYKNKIGEKTKDEIIEDLRKKNKS